MLFLSAFKADNLTSKYYQGGVVHWVKPELGQGRLPADLDGAGEEHQVPFLPDPHEGG